VWKEISDDSDRHRRVAGAIATGIKFTDEGITSEVVAGRRSSAYFIPIARPKKKGKQLAFDTEWTQDRIEENKAVNRIRQRVGM